MTERTAIGGNSPPAEAAFSIECDSLFSLLSDSLSGGEVSNDQQEEAIDALLDDFRKLAKDADKARADEKKPHLDAGKAVDERFKPAIEKANRGATACKDALSPYRIAKQAAKDEAARKVREEAETRQKAAQEALQGSDDLEARYRAEQDLETAKKLTAQANRIDRSATGLRTWYEAEITERGKALRAMIARWEDRFEALMQTIADEQARGARVPIDGVEYIKKQKAN